MHPEQGANAFLAFYLYAAASSFNQAVYQKQAHASTLYPRMKTPKQLKQLRAVPV
ncbi:hypothetical protein GCM10023259_103780 [Thermocatellispora tengchongensis]